MALKLLATVAALSLAAVPTDADHYAKKGAAKADICAAIGVIHVIDTVLPPPTE